MKYAKTSGSALIVVIIILTLIIIATLGYVVWNNFINEHGQESEAQNNPGSSTESPRQDYDMYTNELAGISFQYPSDWEVKETIGRNNTPEWYVLSVRVLNEDGKQVAVFNTGGQIGGLCGDDAPFVAISTIKLDPVTIPGIDSVNFGYTIVKTGEADYGVAFGLVDQKINLGDDSVQCPHMSVNYAYYTTSRVAKLGGMSFGLWYETQLDYSDPQARKSFESFAEAKEYSNSQEFSQIERMVKSLKINSES